MGDTQYEAGSNYLLPRDKTELTRLNTQHIYLMKTVYDGRLIYDESVRLEAGCQVLECGVGTGSWMMDLVKEVPESVELHGIDVSSNNFPKTYPSNIHFSIDSVTRLPAKWKGRFDFVNQRLLMAALLASEWPNALSEIFRVLKPGGHVQFVEMDLPNFAIGGGEETNRWTILRGRLYAAHGLLFDCAVQLPRMLEEAGFMNITSETKYTPVGKSAGRMGELGVLSLGGALRNMVPLFTKSGIFRSETDCNGSLDRLMREWEEMIGVRFVFRIVCARKPFGQTKL